ncbi:RagB/SusD family nutrient uptake outer membrane protein [Echinicola strongylocentroti]|uniref:RagB/SusD family nutrient uptake outer membrane protein n=1 Tax=Echinicola strongylocentroti TaxID=1795355 RepID=A0A2Z4IGU5_9BACT|nr:RagB/SusD family nutrient uptake outer membrane protein [Echinicola strongylocentroti]AWW29698.1 RagB/SusD family nutrient uptake outer membrane protein [Echinicola strongylocentroti]
MKIKTIKIAFNALMLGAAFGFYGCSEYLEEVPYGEVAPDEMSKTENIERAIIASYSILNGQFDGASSAFNSPASNWSFGDVMSDDAYKGGGGTGDQNQIHQMEIYNINPTITDISRKWLALYEGVKRSNYALRLLLESEEFDPERKSIREGELRFLRGHFYFELKKIYNNVPFIDETSSTVDDYYVGNKELNDEELWGKIESDFNAAFDLLPVDQADAGRATKFAAKAYLAKTYAFQGKWQACLEAADEVIASGKYALLPDFREVFLPENDNSEEIIFAVQHSVNDGEPSNYNGSIGDRLSAPGGPYYPQYGFHRPSQNLINSFETNENGLPVMDGELASGDYIDLRLDHTLARPGIPYLDLPVLYEASWARDQATYGPNSPKKRLVSALSEFYVQAWPYVNALNYYVIRYADLLLWKAEAQVELGDLEGARATVNLVRGRAAQSAAVTKLDSEEPADNYQLSTYDQPWTSASAARELVRLERRLELAMEGHRFFDLVRWGVAAETMNGYFETEKEVSSHLVNGRFVEGKHEYFPIPQIYLDIMPEEEVEQNPNY